MDKWCGVEREMGPLVIDTYVGGMRYRYESEGKMPA